MPFLCHACENPFEDRGVAGEGPLCPLCGSEFVEQLDDDDEPTEAAVDDAINANPFFGRLLRHVQIQQHSDQSELPLPFSFPFPFPPGGTFIGAFPNPETNASNNAGNNTPFAETTGVRRTRENNEREPNTSASEGEADEVDGEMVTDGVLSERNARASLENARRRREEVQSIVEMLIQLQMGGIHAAATIPANQRGIPNPLFHLFGGVGEQGDYVFGESGIDDVVTRLMEQQSNYENGPSHLTDEQIARLPRVTVKGSEMGEHPECSVCQEEFSESGEEAVRLAACAHTFHPPCISNWVKLKATCPVCRKEIEMDGGDGSGSGSASV